MIDSHAHIDAPRFDTDRHDVLARAHDAGVTDIIVPATHAAAWPKLESICHERQPALHPAFGLHPMFLQHHDDGDIMRLERWLADHEAVAVGECGLDFFIDDPHPDEQRRLFLAQLHIARDANLPVIIHARRAVDEVIQTLRKIGHMHGVIHSFSGSLQQARQLADLGFLVGIGGPVTHDRAKRLKRTVAAIPLDTLLLETDAPDQPGATHRGERNEPAWLVDTLACIAALRAEDVAVIASVTSANARQLFNLHNAHKNGDGSS